MMGDAEKRVAKFYATHSRERDAIRKRAKEKAVVWLQANHPDVWQTIVADATREVTARRQERP